MISQRNITAVIIALTGVFSFSTQFVTSAVTDQCRQETLALQANEDVRQAFEDLLKDYKDDVENICDFSTSDVPDCGVDISSQNETFSAVCVEAGGQIMDRNVGLQCSLAGVANFDIDIGEIPVCIGISCNTTALDLVNDFNDTRVGDFLDDLSFSGCKATVSAGGKSANLAFFGSAGIASALAFALANFN